MQGNNYVVGRGRLFFGAFAAGTRLATGQRYFGNTPELSLSQSEDTLDHYSSEGGVKIKDASVTLQNDSSGSFSCDNISVENLATWFRGEVIRRIEAGSARASGTITLANAVPVAGDKVTIAGIDITFVAAAPVGNQVEIGASLTATAANLADFINATPPLGVVASSAVGVVTVTARNAGTAGNAITLARTAATPANITVSGATLAGGAVVTETIDGAMRARWYQLGVGAQTPQGLRNLSGVTITGVAVGSYTVEVATGRVFLHDDAPDILDGASLDVTYGINSVIEDVVIAKGESVEGEMQYIANNAHGKNDDYFWPMVRLTPNGDFSLKSDDWLSVTFDFEILKRDELVERQYITRR